ncbi:MAG: type III pantothenate kinase [Nitriliruptorales bacterium]|nr:type III pantothenate kinase [Nitriliruptorales bacterium]
MLLAVDVGNSTTVVGLFQDQKLVHHWRLSTDMQRTSDEFALIVQGLLGFAGLSFTHNVHGLVMSSVVPTLTETLREMVDRYFPFAPVVVEPGTKTGIALRYEHPREIGADRIVNAVAAFELYGGPAIVVDFGTATSFDAINGRGEFVGGAIAPGVHTSTEALVAKAARLPKVETMTPPTAIGRSTTAALQSGIVYGFAGQVDAIVERISEELGSGVTTVATGGLAPAVLDACTRLDHSDPWLTLKGLRIIWERNT